jgi:hypothetical protein
MPRDLVNAEISCPERRQVDGLGLSEGVSRQDAGAPDSRHFVGSMKDPV